MILLVTYEAIQDFLNHIAPPYLEEEWDNSGIQVKHNRKKLNTLLIGLDPTLDFVQKGVQVKADLLISHHPLFFNPLKSIDTNSLPGKKLSNLINNKIGLISIHTPFDLAENGLSQALAERLNLESIKTLKPVTTARLIRLVIFVPRSYEDEVVNALLDVGLGRIGDYKNGYYRSDSEGFFEPLPSANPKVDIAEKRSPAPERRLEFLMKPQLKDKAIPKLLEVHPYEEPAYTFEETERIDQSVGLGRIGKLNQALTYNQVVEMVGNSLEVENKDIITTGNPRNLVKTIAVSPGAGGEAVRPTLRAGVDLLVTGELDYHERLEASEKGLPVIEVGHYNSEKIFSPWLSQLLGEKFSKSELQVYEYSGGETS